MLKLKLIFKMIESMGKKKRINVSFSFFAWLQQEAGHEGSVGIQPCAGCGCRIVDRHVYYALDRYWHNNCLKCTACGSLLADIGPSCYAKNQMILCKSDYRR